MLCGDTGVASALILPPSALSVLARRLGIALLSFLLCWFGFAWTRCRRRGRLRTRRGHIGLGSGAHALFSFRRRRHRYLFHLRFGSSRRSERSVGLIAVLRFSSKLGAF